MMWKFLRGGATFIPGATSIPESRVPVPYKVTQVARILNYTSFSIPQTLCISRLCCRSKRVFSNHIRKDSCFSDHDSTSFHPLESFKTFNTKIPVDIKVLILTGIFADSNISFEYRNLILSRIFVVSVKICNTLVSFRNNWPVHILLDII